MFNPPLILQATETEFQAAIRDEFINKSGICPDLFETIAEFTTDQEIENGEIVGEPIAEFLNWEIKESQPGFSNRQTILALLLRNEDGTPFQAKLNQQTWDKSKERYGKPYKAPRRSEGEFSPAYLPPIGKNTRKSLGLPLDGSFWDSVEADPTIPIVIGEGGKKSACALSHGITTIALYGVDAGSKKVGGEHVLIPDLARFCQPGRNFIIAFDKDENPQTVERVNRAIARLSWLLGKQAKKISVKVAQWSASNGKGLDDLVVNCGPEALHKAIAEAQSPKARKYQEFFTLTEKPSIVLNQRYLPKIPLPIQPGNLAVSSPTGSGKTEIIEDLLYQFFQRHPDGLADAIGYRNNLLIQTTQRINSKGRIKITHKHDMGVNSGGWNGAPSLAYCLNSADKRIQAFHQAMDEGRSVLILLDEIGFIVTHWLDMMRSQPKTGMNFARLLRRIGQGKGYIVGLQANLTAFPINLIREITGQAFPLTLVENKYQGEPWKVSIRSVLSKKSTPSNHPSILGIGTGQTVLEALQGGQFPLVTTSSREWLELLDAVLTGQGFKLLRIDRFTVAAAQKAGQDATPDQKIILKIRENPKEAIEQARAMGYNAIGLTPTCETGISIDHVHFDQIIEYAPAGTSEGVLQRLARDRRNETPRTVFATDRAADYRPDISPDPDRILKSWRLNAAQGFNLAKVNESLTPEEKTALDDICQDDLPKILSKFAAADLVRSNSDKESLNKNIEDRLKAEGHHVTHDEMVISSEFRDLWKSAKTTIADRNRQMFAAAVVTTSDEAHDTLRSGNGTREQIYSAQKTITLENYPGLDLDDPARAGRLMIDRRGKGLGDFTQFWMLKNPAVAEQIDRACWKGHIGRGIVWAPSLKREALKVQTLADTGILAVIALDEYSEDSSEVQTLRSHCIQNCPQLRRVCGYAAAFDESHSGVEMVGWILRRLEYKQAVSRKVGGRGEQVRFYKAVDRNPGDRSLVEAALAVKWESMEPIQDKDSMPGSHHFSVLKPDIKMVTTDVPNLAEWRDSTPIVATDEAEIYEYIPTPEELTEWAIVA